MSDQTRRLGLALLGDVPDPLLLRNVLLNTSAKATLFPSPVSLVSHPGAWRELHADGFRLGNGTLLEGALQDGSFPLWTPDMIRAAIADADQLLLDEFGVSDPVLAIPSGSPECAKGARYLFEIAHRKLLIVGPLVSEAIQAGHEAMAAEDISELEPARLRECIEAVEYERVIVKLKSATSVLLIALLTQPNVAWVPVEDCTLSAPGSSGVATEAP